MLHQDTSSNDAPTRKQGPSRFLWVLLLVPYIGLLAVPLYNVQSPQLFGIPFFYWYQLGWVPVTSLLMWLVYRGLRHDD
jgi:hypothetical protein